MFFIFPEIIKSLILYFSSKLNEDFNFTFAFSIFFKLLLINLFVNKSDICGFNKSISR